jgi:hypothetical protein
MTYRCTKYDGDMPGLEASDVVLQEREEYRCTKYDGNIVGLPPETCTISSPGRSKKRISEKGMLNSCSPTIE